MNSYQKGGKTLYYKIEEKNIKHGYFKAQKGYILITKPYKMALKRILAKLDSSFESLYQLSRYKKENQLSLWGKTYEIKQIEENGFSYKIEKDVINVYSNHESLFAIKKAILAAETTDYLDLNYGRFEKVLKANNLYPVRISVKYLKSKYGSYHYVKDYIVINSFLATLEKNFLDYVLFHEYAHQKEKNHQQPFYLLLDKLFKDHKKYQKLLKTIPLNI